MGKNRQLPSSIIVPEFGEVNVREEGDRLEVMFTVAMEPQGVNAEGWQTGVAIDGSASMREWFGKTLLGKIPAEAKQEYVKAGWIYSKTEDGRSVEKVTRKALDDAIARGYLHFSENIVQPIAREFIGYLADNLDADGGTTVIYWACGSGKATEVIGDFTGEQCRKLELKGPTREGFGNGTHLKPAVEYFVNRFANAARGMYLFITDGRLDDLEEVKQLTRMLARDIAAEKRHPVKCVLIGVGNEIDESQMEQLDDLDTGTDVDIWDHKIAREMRSLVEIFAEVVDENMLIAPTARIFDDRGRMVKQFTDGMTAKVTFTMPVTSTFFELEIGDRRIRQVFR